MEKGVVVKSTGSWYMVRLENGILVECRIRGKFRIEGIRTNKSGCCRGCCWGRRK